MGYGELSNTQETMVMPLLQMKNIRGRPYITVSAKGMVNGLSNIPNDGADFGPDTTEGATAPGQYGGTYTETVGIQEAFTYLESSGGEIRLADGIFYLSTGATYTSGAPLRISGIRPNFMRGVTFTSQMSKGTLIMPASDYPTNNMPLFKFLNTAAGNNYGFVDIGNMGIIGTYIEVGDTVPNGASSTSPVALQFGNTTSSDGGGPVAKNVHDMKIDNCVSAIVSYSGGGPNFYGNLHTDGCGYAGTVTINGSTYSNPQTFILNDLSSHWGRIEVFSPGGHDAFAINNGAGGYAPTVLIDNLYTTSPDYGVFNFLTTLTGVYLAIGVMYLSGNANNGVPIFELPASGSLTAYIANLYQNGNALVRQYNSSSTARVDIAVANYHATNSAQIVSSGNSVASGSRLAISNAYLESLYSSALTESITGLTWTMAHIYPTQVPTTPSVPTSATAQENTNSYAVDVYVYGGDVTEIQITKGGTAYTVFSVSTAIAMSGQAYKLNPGDSITVTYSTAPTWEWLSD